MNKIDGKLDMLVGKVIQLSTDMKTQGDEMKNQIGKVKTQGDEMKNQIGELKIQGDEMKNQIGEVKTQGDEMKNKIGEMDNKLTSNIKEVASQLGGMEKKVEKIDADVIELNSTALLSGWKYYGRGIYGSCDDFICKHPHIPTMCEVV